MDNNPLGLSQLVFDIKLTLQSAYEMPVWVVGEISDLNINRSGHCYLELIEKDSLSDKIIAKARATIWSFAFRQLKPFFETATGETFRAGLKVLLKVSVEFHEVYGFSLNVQDIDPNFTLGDLARQRAAIIEQLNQDGVIDLNKSLRLATVPQRIAVISSETAAGYGDFLDQLNKNELNFKIVTQLFPAIMQGDQASESIINALNHIFDRIEDFDAVVIIRGGGAKSDLSCFDDYELAYFITQFPLPVLTGIGHERDDTVTDMVAHTRLKTPTAVAEFIIQKFSDFIFSIDELGNKLREISVHRVEEAHHEVKQHMFYLSKATNDLLSEQIKAIEKAKVRIKSGVHAYCEQKQSDLHFSKQSIKMLTHSFLINHQQLLSIRKIRLKKWLNNYLKAKNQQLELADSHLDVHNPEVILKKGYAMVSSNGNIIQNSKELKVGARVHIHFYNGSAEAEIKKTKE